MPSSGQDTAIAVTDSQQPWVPVQSLHKNGPFSSQAWMGKRVTRHSWLLDHLLLIDSGKGEIIACSCVPSDDPTRFKWIVSPWSWHRRLWLNQMGYKTKPKVMNLGKRTGREEQVLIGMGGRQKRAGERVIRMIIYGLDGSVVKSMHCPCKDLSWSPSTHVRRLITACNSNSRGIGQLWPLRVLIIMCTCAHTDNIIKILKNHCIYMWKFQRLKT